jgi:hypothetical protein
MITNPLIVVLGVINMGVPVLLLVAFIAGLA